MRSRAERLRLLDESRLYVIGPAHLRAGRLADWIGRLHAAGAGIIQLRDRTLGPAELAAAARACADAARHAGALFIVNDDPELARACGADGVHLGQGDGAIAWARGIVGPDAIIGRSSPGGALLAAAAAEGADYASVSPLWATPTKPGRPAAGLDAAIDAARRDTIPWFALGGLDRRRAERVAAIGARRLAVVRDVVEADDPAVAAHALIACLDTDPRVLAIAGSDSGGGAGIQADVKAIAMAGGFPMTAVTALTAQSTVGVDAVLPVPADFVVRQIQSAVDDLGVDAVKTGMLGDAGVIEAVASALATLDPELRIPIVVDPVMRAESGASLLADDAVRVLRERLAPLARVLTPNLFEAQALAGADTDDASELARRTLDATGAEAVVVTGGHGPTSADVLCDADGVRLIDGPRLDVPHTHGAGCTYASTLATLLGGGMPLDDAAAAAKRTATAAVRAGRAYGAGAGPVDVIRAARG